MGYPRPMTENKTTPTAVGVPEFIETVEPASKREDAQVLEALFRKATGADAVMWGPSIIGFGSYVYQSSGRDNRMCRVGFSPRKARHSLYISCQCGDEEDPAFTKLLERLGKAKRGGGGCLYVNKLADIDLGVLERMVAMSWANSNERFPQS